MAGLEKLLENTDHILRKNEEIIQRTGEDNGHLHLFDSEHQGLHFNTDMFPFGWDFKPFKSEYTISPNTSRVLENFDSKIADKRTLELAEIEELHKVIDYTETGIGSATVLKTLIQPHASEELIRSKQEGVEELRRNEQLRESIVDFLDSYQNTEHDLMKFLNHDLQKMNPYGDFKRAMDSITQIPHLARSIPEPDTEYLGDIVSKLEAFEDSEMHTMARGTIQRTLDGVKSKDEVSWYTPRVPLRPSRVSPSTALPFGLLFASPFIEPSTYQQVAETANTLLNTPIPENPELTGAAIAGTAGNLSLMYMAFMKPGVDQATAMHPVRNRMTQDEEFLDVTETVGRLDELISFLRYHEKADHPTTTPTVTKAEAHFYSAQDMLNPVQAAKNPDYVANDATLDENLTFITGPNSGGKTSYCKSILQNQILAQAGAPVAASEAQIGIADKIAYQAPKFDELEDDEGRFGKELKRTRDIFYETTPKSLILLDELAEGTTADEKTQHSEQILNGFNAIGNSTVFVTHNYDLVDKFKEAGTGQFLKAEFNGQQPTHNMVEGISRKSHADLVADRIGFNGDEIQQYLEENDYIS